MPTSSARQLSRSAPAKISLALAVCSFTMSVRGEEVSGGPTALTARSSRRAPVSVTTTGAPSARVLACYVNEWRSSIVLYTVACMHACSSPPRPSTL